VQEDVIPISSPPEGAVRLQDSLVEWCVQGSP
jgi:hypothetical protein